MLYASSSRFPPALDLALITNKIAELTDWRGKTLARLRKIILDAAPELEGASSLRPCLQSVNQDQKIAS
jgi:hypothetical protein